jgi:hypothetical protein
MAESESEDTWDVAGGGGGGDGVETCRNESRLGLLLTRRAGHPLPGRSSLPCGTA